MPRCLDGGRFRKFVPLTAVSARQTRQSVHSHFFPGSAPFDGFAFVTRKKFECQMKNACDKKECVCVHSVAMNVVEMDGSARKKFGGQSGASARREAKKDDAGRTLSEINSFGSQDTDDCIHRKP